MNCYLSKTNLVVDAISTRSCYAKKSERALDFFARFSALLSWCVCHHRRYSFRRRQNCAPYNRLICQTVQNEPFPWDAVMHIACICERLARLQIQFRISRSFPPRNPANLGSKIRFWINLVPRALFPGFGGGAVSQRFGHPRVLGIPIPISLAFWASPVGDAQNADRFDFA